MNKKSDREYALVYSTDGPVEKNANVIADQIKPAVRIEKKGRGGKSVTVLFKLPAHETLLKDLCAMLKKSLGTGGTFYKKDGEGIVEIQGERQEEALKVVDKFKKSWKPGK